MVLRRKVGVVCIVYYICGKERGRRFCLAAKYIFCFYVVLLRSEEVCWVRDFTLGKGFRVVFYSERNNFFIRKREF